MEVKASKHNFSHNCSQKNKGVRKWFQPERENIHLPQYNSLKLRWFQNVGPLPFFTLLFLVFVQEYLRRLLHYFGQCWAHISRITVVFKLFRKVRLITLVLKYIETGPLALYKRVPPKGRYCSYLTLSKVGKQSTGCMGKAHYSSFTMRQNSTVQWITKGILN